MLGNLSVVGNVAAGQGDSRAGPWFGSYRAGARFYGEYFAFAKLGLTGGAAEPILARVGGSIQKFKSGIQIEETDQRQISD